MPIVLRRVKDAASTTIAAIPVLRESAPPGQIEYVPVPPPLELDPLMLPEALPDDENDDPLDLLPEPLLEPLEEPDVDAEPEPEPEPEADADPLTPVCAVASAMPLVAAASFGRSLWVHTPSAEYTLVPGT